VPVFSGQETDSLLLRSAGLPHGDALQVFLLNQPFAPKTLGGNARTIWNDRIVISRLFTFLLHPARHMLKLRANPASMQSVESDKPETHIGNKLEPDELDAFLLKAQTSPVYPAVILCLSGLLQSGPAALSGRMFT